MKKNCLLSLCFMLFAMVFVSCAEHDLNYFVDGFKSELPQDMGNGLQMTDVAVVDDYVQIEITSDETEIDLGNEMVGAFLPAIAEGLKAEFVDADDMKEFMQACSNEGKGFRMVMKGAKSGNTAPLFDVTPDEVKAKFPPQPKE
ncbi:MAG: hypothetical protein II905_08155 [Muribaculaceae bacterium]|jgi:hypothetical protein|nr:hypothetical protein [Muribaculaceae bacterium]